MHAEHVARDPAAPAPQQRAEPCRRERDRPAERRARIDLPRAERGRRAAVLREAPRIAELRRADDGDAPAQARRDAIQQRRAFALARAGPQRVRDVRRDAREPARRGAAITTTTNSSPRYSAHARDTPATTTLSPVSTAAPAAGPKNEPAPPITAAISTVAERAIATLSGVAISTSISVSVPATPAKNDAHATIASRTRRGSVPSAASRAGLSRTAFARRASGVRVSARIASADPMHHAAISAYACAGAPNCQPPSGGPLARSIGTPPTPPNHAGTLHAAAATHSPRPSVIIANAVPARRVASTPNSRPKAAPAAPPTSGSSGSGPPKRLNQCAAANAPRPANAAWPNDSRPVVPSCRLYDSASTTSAAVCAR